MSRRAVLLTPAALSGVAAVVAVALVGPARVPSLIRSAVAAVDREPDRPGPRPQAPEPTGAELVPERPDTLRLPADVAGALRITAEPAEAPDCSKSLVLSGSLALDTNRLAHVHSRFAGEVVELGTMPDPDPDGDGLSGPGEPTVRPIRFGDRVEAGQLLAVLWSSDLGEKKSEYVDALSQLRLERETLDRQEALFKDLAIAERNLREARRAVEAARIDVARVERTLRSWRLSEDELAAIRAEAEALFAEEAARDPGLEGEWARVELRAPHAGTVLEVNLSVGDIVTTDADLYKIADLSDLRVWAYVYEEDLPALLALPEPIRWSVRLKADPDAPPIAGTIERIGDLIDPNQHTALVVGRVDNPGRLLRAGQFITATIDLPPDPDEVEIPIAGLVEDGQESVVFVQPDPREPAFAMRRVAVSRRLDARAYLDRPASPGDGGGPPTAEFLRPGDLVVTSGAVELKAALAGLQNAAKERKRR